VAAGLMLGFAVLVGLEDGTSPLTAIEGDADGAFVGICVGDSVGVFDGV
jgi:hypothetical protein